MVEAIRALNPERRRIGSVAARIGSVAALSEPFGIIIANELGGRDPACRLRLLRSFARTGLD